MREEENCFFCKENSNGKTIVSVLHCNSACFTMQKSLFCCAKQALLVCQTMGITKYWQSYCYAFVIHWINIYSFMVLFLMLSGGFRVG